MTLTVRRGDDGDSGLLIQYCDCNTPKIRIHIKQKNVFSCATKTQFFGLWACGAPLDAGLGMDTLFFRLIRLAFIIYNYLGYITMVVKSLLS